MIDMRAIFDNSDFSMIDELCEFSNAFDEEFLIRMNRNFLKAHPDSAERVVDRLLTEIGEMGLVDIIRKQLTEREKDRLDYALCLLRMSDLICTIESVIKSENWIDSETDILESLYNIIIDYRNRNYIDSTKRNEDVEFCEFYWGLCNDLQQSVIDAIGDIIFKSYDIILLLHLCSNINGLVLHKKGFDNDNLKEMFNTTKKQCLNLFLNCEDYTARMLERFSIIPRELRVPEAVSCWKNLVKYGFLNNRLQSGNIVPSISELAYIGKCFSDRFNYKDSRGYIPWGDFFDIIWDKKRGALADALCKSQNPDKSNMPRIELIDKCFILS